LPMVLNPGKDGLQKVLRDYQIEAMTAVWGNAEEGVTSREVHAQVNEALVGVRTVSRASIINFLNAMCDDGVLTYEEETCKGGTRRKYFPRLDEDGFKEHIGKTVFKSLLKDFPDQTISALYESLNLYPSLKAKLQGRMST